MPFVALLVLAGLGPFDVTPGVKATVEFVSPAASFSRATVVVLDATTNRELLRVVSPRVVVDHDVASQRYVLPYDVDFDGQVDLAVMEGDGCAGMPRYQVFLRHDGRYVKSAPLTDLGRKGCGFFKVDAEQRTLSTLERDGCCWHQTSVFTVVDGKPVPERVTTEDAKRFPAIAITRKVWTQGAAQVTTVRRLHLVPDDEDDTTTRDIQVLSQFSVTTGQEVVLFLFNERLTFALRTSAGDVELLADGQYTRDGETVTFRVGATTYTIDAQAPLLRVRSKAQPERVLTAVAGTAAGNLRALYGKSVTNDASP